MCGFAGILGSPIADATTLRTMADAINYRGPDDAGYWWDTNTQIGLAHRRLSILDLTQAGHQPMTSSNGRYVIAFNGEIYNHQDLRVTLEAISTRDSKVWRGHSDTETLLAAIETWGLEFTLKKTIGMFSLALWDKEQKTLSLARDRVGEKPLYYGWQGDGARRSFLFGSELKALKANPVFSAKVDRGSLCLLLRHNYIPSPHSIYEGIAKLEPGCILSVSLIQPEPIINRYWDVVEVARKGRMLPFVGTPEQAVNSLGVLANDAVRLQMLSDVPLGALLSGGIDSSTVVALMQSQSSRPIKTFTIGFNEEGFNEAVYAKGVAKHLGTDHTELYVTPLEALNVIPKLPTLYCEPFADSSQIPTYLVSQLAKQHVTVSLSGDGGDELFCGYNRYELCARLWKKLLYLPLPLRKIASRLILSIPSASWDWFGDFIPENYHYAAFGDKMHKGADVLASSNLHQLYLGIVSQVTDPVGWVINGYEPPTKLTSNTPTLNEFSNLEQMMLLDMVSYLPDDILVKVDRAAMGVSLEGRVPFLDHRIIDFAWSLPLDYKLRNGQTKWPLRQLLYQYVPKELIERPKMGFGVPIGDWLRGPLRDWAEELLSENRLKREGYFYPHEIRAKWAEHLSGRRNWQTQLWTVLMFQSWLENEI